LRYLDAVSSMARELQALPPPEVSFNYLGQFGQERTLNSIFNMIQGNAGPTNSPRQTRKHLLDINALVAEGQLRVDWTFSRNIHRRQTIETHAGNFIQALHAIISQDKSSRAVPSDFPDVEMDQAELELVLAEIDFDSGDVRDEPEGY